MLTAVFTVSTLSSPMGLLGCFTGARNLAETDILHGADRAPSLLASPLMVRYDGGGW